MSDLSPKKLHVTNNIHRARKGESIIPRRYTLTHSDSTGDLFLTVAEEFDLAQVSGWYTRFMRDEVFAEWKAGSEEFELWLYCHVSGGIVFGPAGWRYQIFRHHMPMVLQAFRFGDAELFEEHPILDEAPVKVQYAARQAKYRLVEDWGEIRKYRLRD